MPFAKAIAERATTSHRSRPTTAATLRNDDSTTASARCDVSANVYKVGDTDEMTVRG